MAAIISFIEYWTQSGWNPHKLQYFESQKYFLKFRWKILVIQPESEKVLLSKMYFRPTVDWHSGQKVWNCKYSEFGASFYNFFVAPDVLFIILQGDIQYNNHLNSQ